MTKKPRGPYKDQQRTIRVMVRLNPEEDAIITAAQSRMSIKGKGTCLRRLALNQAEEEDNSKPQKPASRNLNSPSPSNTSRGWRRRET